MSPSEQLCKISSNSLEVFLRYCVHKAKQSNQFIIAFNWMFAPNLKRFPLQGFHEIKRDGEQPEYIITPVSVAGPEELSQQTELHKLKSSIVKIEKDVMHYLSSVWAVCSWTFLCRLQSGSWSSRSAEQNKNESWNISTDYSHRTENEKDPALKFVFNLTNVHENSSPALLRAHQSQNSYKTITLQ